MYSSVHLFLRVGGWHDAAVCRLKLVFASLAISLSLATTREREEEEFHFLGNSIRNFILILSFASPSLLHFFLFYLDATQAQTHYLASIKRFTVCELEVKIRRTKSECSVKMERRCLCRRGQHQILCEYFAKTKLISLLLSLNS